MSTASLQTLHFETRPVPLHQPLPQPHLLRPPLLINLLAVVSAPPPGAAPSSDCSCVWGEVGSWRLAAKGSLSPAPHSGIMSRADPVYASLS